MPIVDIALFGIGIITALLTLLLLIRDSKNINNRSLAFFTFIAALWPFFISLFRLSTTIESAYFWDRAIYFIASLVPAVFLYFCYIFANQKLPSKVIHGFCIIAPVIFLGLLFFSPWWIQSIVFTPAGKKVFFGVAYTIWVIYYQAYIIWGSMILWFKFKRSKGLMHSQSALMLLSLLFPMFGAMAPNVIMPLFGNYDYIYVGPFFVSAMLGLMTYAIVKHKLFDVRLIIVKSIAYTFIISLLAILYTVGLFFIIPILTKETVSLRCMILSAILALIVSFTIQPLTRLIEKITNRVFYRHRYKTDEMLFELSQVLASTIEMRELVTKILDLIRRRLHITTIMMIIKDSKQRFIIESHPQISTHYRIDTNTFDTLRKNNRLLYFDDLKESEEKVLMRKYAISVFLPIATKREVIGYLLLGEKASGDCYYDQDIKTLKILASEFAVALTNAKSYAEIIGFNITLQKEIEKATMDLRLANLHLQELDKLKNEFISIASHDLRTPMTALKGYSWLLKQKGKDLAPQFIDYINKIYNSSERMIALINDMLDVSRIESGNLTLALEKIDIVETVNTSANEMKPLIEDKHQSLKIEPFHPVFVKADKNRMHEVMENLIANAVNYTDVGGKITLSFQETKKEILVSVTDTGVGIKKDDFPKLFTKFGRIDISHTVSRQSSGTGLGLYICKNIIDLSGGSIMVDSEPGKGSTFTFSLPIIN